MRARATFALLALGGALLSGALAACSGPAGEPPEPSGARALGGFSRDRAESAEEQALEALEQEAYGREARFLEAASPGSRFASTRIAEREIESGAYDLGEVYAIGAELFHLRFDRSLGFGGRDRPRLRRVHEGRRGGPDAYRCAACHWRGGIAGAGDGADLSFLEGDGERLGSALPRNPPSLAGLGWVELAARQTTAGLAELRALALREARAQGRALTIPLLVEGVSFGRLSARPDGSLDASEVEGIDADLVVRPFGREGRYERLLEVVELELLVHHGMESTHLVEEGDPARVGPYGGEDPEDPDGDGVREEVSEGQLMALTLFVALQAAPVQTLPEQPDLVAAYGDGRALFESLGCASCHRPSIELRSSVYSLPPRAPGRPGFSLDLERQAARPIPPRAAEDGALRLYLYSDLRRHEMGEALADPSPREGRSGAEFLTPPLWGVARSRPYLHDGRAASLEAAILLHGGEAEASRAAYEALPDEERGHLRVFLTALTRAPVLEAAR